MCNMDGPVEQDVPRCNFLHHKNSMKWCENFNLNFVLVKVKNVKIYFISSHTRVTIGR